MEDYTIYCTEEQTRKALELGAPIESEFEYQFLANQEHGYYRGGTFQRLAECMGENTMIFGNEPNRVACIIPTAEQMIGWLEEQNMLFVIDPYTKDRYCCAFNHGTEYVMDSHVGTRKEATLAAIDAALEYLEHKQ